MATMQTHSAIDATSPRKAVCFARRVRALAVTAGVAAMLIATNDLAGDVARLDDSPSPAAVKPKRAALNPQERTRRRRIREEKQRIADAKMQAYYSDEDCEKLAEFRGHWANELPPDAERVTVILMIEGPRGDCHNLIDRVVILPEGGIDSVMRDVYALAERADMYSKGRNEQRSPGKSDSTARTPAKINRGKLPAQVVESIEKAKGSLLEHVLGNRVPVLISVSVPNDRNDYTDSAIMKAVAISDRPDALEAACRNAIEFARSIDPQATLSDDLIR